MTFVGVVAANGTVPAWVPTGEMAVEILLSNSYKEDPFYPKYPNKNTQNNPMSQISHITNYPNNRNCQFGAIGL